MVRFYLMETAFFRQLKADSKDILEYAKSLGSIAERHKARTDFLAELAAAGRIFTSPKPGTDPKTLYRLDSQGVAHIPIVGELTPVAEQDICGGYTASALTEYGYIVDATSAAIADENVVSIDYEIDSPGGYVSGVESAAQAMASSPKPTRAVVGNMATSAAYWLASQTDQIVASSPLSRVGSIGVLVEGYSDEQMLADMGIEHFVITSSGAPNKYADPATDEGKAKIKAELDKIEAVFIQRVADGRGVSVAKVQKDFGRGGVKMANDALASGMVDSVLAQNISRDQPSGVAGTAVKTAKTQDREESKMTLDELKANAPDVYAAVKAEGKSEGIAAERDRVSGINRHAGTSAAHAKICAEAVAQGKSESDIMPELIAAATKATQENAPLIPTATATPSGLDAEDVQAAKLFGMSVDEYRKGQAFTASLDKKEA